MLAAVEQRGRGVVGARGLLEHPRVGEGGDDHLRGGVDRAALALLAVLGRLPGALRPPRSPASPEQLVDLGLAGLGPSSSQRTTDASSRPLARRGEEQRRQQLLRRRVPEVRVLQAAARRCAAAARASAPPASPRASCRSPASGVARDARQPGDPGGVEDHHLAERAAPGEGVEQQVALDRGREHRPLPLQQRRDRQAGRLAALGRGDDDHRLALLGGEQVAAGRPRVSRPGCGARRAARAGRGRSAQRALGGRRSRAALGQRRPAAEPGSSRSAEGRERARRGSARALE